MKFTLEDEICQLDLGLAAAERIIAIRFKNWIEDEWEFRAIVTMNVASSTALRAKYTHVYFIDPDASGCVEVRRVVDVEWQKGDRRNPSMYYVVTILVSRDGELAAEIEDDAADGGGYEAYTITAELHGMIAAADEHNVNYEMIEKPLAIEEQHL
jgi:hypothetical protein